MYCIHIGIEISTHRINDLDSRYVFIYIIVFIVSIPVIKDTCDIIFIVIKVNKYFSHFESTG